MLHIQTHNRCILFGDNMGDVAAYLTDAPRQWRQQSSVTNRASSSWDLNADWDGALRMARDGWSDGARDLHNRLATLPPNMIEAEWRYDVVGAAPDVGRFVSGDPECMRDYGHPLGRKPTVHLVLNGVCSAAVNANDYRNYGTAILAIVDQLENNGRSVQVDITFVHAGLGSLGGAGTGVFGWNVKRAGDVADLSSIAFSIAHPAAFRRLGFALVERSPSSWNTPGYGRCASITPELAKFIDAENAFLLGGIGAAAGACSTTAGALKFAAQEINKAAGEELVILEGN